MKRMLIVGCGDVALRTVPLVRQSYRVFALVRNAAYCERLRSLGVVPIVGDLDDRGSLSRLSGIAEVLLHFAPPPSTGSCDTRTRNLLSALSHGSLPTRLVYISTSGVYGDCHGAWVSETQPAHANSLRAQRRVDAERQIRGWARQNHVRASILRVPGIYAEERLPLERLRQGTPCVNAEEDGYTNHIHADDLARISVAALRRGRPCRVYHASDDSGLKMGEYFDLVADAHGLPRVPRITRDQAQRELSPMLLSFMNESRRLNNSRMKHELRVKLRYPMVGDMLDGMAVR